MKLKNTLNDLVQKRVGGDAAFGNALRRSSNFDGQSEKLNG